jgi:FKBP-type peptidyl-prolyl cis-trans isomerase
MKRKSSYRVVLKSNKIVESLSIKDASRREIDNKVVLVLKIKVNGEERELKKRLSDIRSLFHQICALFPILVTPVSYPEDIDTEQDMEKAKSQVETYLQGLLSCKNLGPLLYSWCSPGEAVEVSESEDKTTTIEYAVALSDWEPKDSNELRLKEGDHITVLKHDPSGWWIGRTADGREGQFPVTFVHVFQGRVGEETTSTSDLDEEDLDVEEYNDDDDDDDDNNNDETSTKQQEQQKVKSYPNQINDFCLNDMDAFDDLCEKGWAISERKSTQTDGPTATPGDRVEVEYAAYIWDGLSTQISKYESTDDMNSESDTTISICVGEGVHVEALEECLTELRAGDSVTLISTPGKGYGPKGRRPKVPGDVHLVFMLTVVSIVGGTVENIKKTKTIKSPAPPSKVQSKVNEAMRKLRARRDRIVLEPVKKKEEESKEKESKPKPKLVPRSKPTVETREDARPVVTKRKPRLMTPEKSRQTAEDQEEPAPVLPVRRTRKKSADPPPSLPPSLPPSRAKKKDEESPPVLPPSRVKKKKKEEEEEDGDKTSAVLLPPQKKNQKQGLKQKKKKKKKKKVAVSTSSSDDGDHVAGPKHTLNELLDMKKSKKYHGHIQPKKLEVHLHDDEFKKHFGMDKSEYSKLPSWAQQQRKKKVGL